MWPAYPGYCYDARHYYYTEWPGTGHSRLWEGIIGGSVLLWHTVMWSLWHNFKGILQNVFLSICQKKYWSLSPLTITLMIIVRSSGGKGLQNKLIPQIRNLWTFIWLFWSFAIALWFYANLRFTWECRSDQSRWLVSIVNSRKLAGNDKSMRYAEQQIVWNNYVLIVTQKRKLFYNLQILQVWKLLHI